MQDWLDVLADIWNEEKHTDPIAVIEYLRKLRERLQQAREIVNDTETKATRSSMTAKLSPESSMKVTWCSCYYPNSSTNMSVSGKALMKSSKRSRQLPMLLM